MIAVNAGIQTIKLFLIKYTNEGLKMELSSENKEVIKNMFNEYLIQYKQAGIAHNEAITLAMHKTRQNASVMIKTYFK
jgi:hypothetical protein